MEITRQQLSCMSASFHLGFVLESGIPTLQNVLSHISTGSIETLSSDTLFQNSSVGRDFTRNCGRLVDVVALVVVVLVVVSVITTLPTD